MGRAERPTSERGFTLIEMLVALAVFALAALALLKLEGESIARTADLDQRFLREVVAQNLAAETLTDPAPPALGAATGTVSNMGRNFAWQRRVAAQESFGVLAITIRVREVTPGALGTAYTLDFTRLPAS
ncbi:type II secretion system minor pseudopilin GspI [Novosphingobium lentum]|uniref:type II secretion system minor pseudopilin GspI n=1 Tax=Novosphingobium lentum TaxID=145287 RepID=UPI0009FF4814|nr:type II secretion system minor pseudopilin GspI [Novosphingobium lentum]